MIRVRYSLMGFNRERHLDHEMIAFLATVPIPYAVSLTRCPHPLAERVPNVGTLGCGNSCPIELCDTCGTYLPAHRATYGCAQ